MPGSSRSLSLSAPGTVPGWCDLLRLEHSRRRQAPGWVRGGWRARSWRDVSIGNVVVRFRGVAKVRWLVAVVLCAASAVIIGWVVGDQATPDYGAGLDYMVRPISIPRAASTTIILTSLVAYPASVVLLRRLSDGDVRDRWMRALLPLTLAGALCGAVYRVVTAGVIGANIGGSLAVMVGFPLFVVLVVWATRTIRVAAPRDAA